jgi:hypothetical protein
MIVSVDVHISVHVHILVYIVTAGMLLRCLTWALYIYSWQLEKIDLFLQGEP